jgi:hypothetical protein
VGNSKDAIFRSNEHFREAVADREAMDVAELESRLGRKLERAERARIGVGQLRRFLEHLLQRRWGAHCSGWAGGELSWLARWQLASWRSGKVVACAWRLSVCPLPAPSSPSHPPCLYCHVYCLYPCRYLENVPTIVPVLEKEYRNASRRLEETQVELNDLHPEKLKVGGWVVGWWVGRLVGES